MSTTENENMQKIFFKNLEEFLSNVDSYDDRITSQELKEIVENNSQNIEIIDSCFDGEIYLTIQEIKDNYLELKLLKEKEKEKQAQISNRENKGIKNEEENKDSPEPEERNKSSSKEGVAIQAIQNQKSSEEVNTKTTPIFTGKEEEELIKEVKMETDREREREKAEDYYENMNNCELNEESSNNENKKRENLVLPSNVFSLFSKEGQNRKESNSNNVNQIPEVNVNVNLSGKIPNDELIFPANKNKNKILNKKLDIEEQTQNSTQLENENKLLNKLKNTEKEKEKDKLNPSGVKFSNKTNKDYYNPKTSKFNDILNAFPDKKYNKNSLFPYNLNDKASLFSNYKNEIGDSNLLEKIKSKQDDRKEDTIIYPSNSKKLVSFEEKQNEYLDYLSRGNERNSEGENAQDRIAQGQEQRQEGHYTFKKTTAGPIVGVDDSFKHLVEKNSTSLLSSLTNTKKMIEGLSSLNSNNKSSLNRINNLNSKLNENYDNKPKKQQKIREFNNEIISQVNEMPINKAYKENIVVEEQKNSPTVNKEKISKKDNEYFMNLYKNVTESNRNCSLLDEKVSKISSQVNDYEERKIKPSFETAYFPNSKEQQFSTNQQSKFNEELEKMVATDTRYKIGGLLDELDFKLKPEKIDTKLNSDLPNVDLKDERSKKNYASVIKKNLDAFNRQKSEIHKNRGDFLDNINKQLTTMTKKERDEEGTNHTMAKFQEFLTSTENEKNKHIQPKLHEDGQEINVKDKLGELSKSLNHSNFKKNDSKEVKEVNEKPKEEIQEEVNNEK